MVAQVYSGLWLMIAVPAFMAFLAPNRCIESATLSLYGVLFGLRGVTDLVLWMLCVPGMWEMTRLYALVPSASLPACSILRADFVVKGD